MFDAAGELKNMVVYPIYPTQLGPDPPDMVTLTQGLRKGVRLNDTGMVSQVHVKNPLDTTVLVGESDVLIGPTQLRSVQFSCLVPAPAPPVACVASRCPRSMEGLDSRRRQYP